MPRQIALLRGINLGARNRVSMPELRELLEGLGHEDVRTLLQSGNVVLTSATTGARYVARVAAQGDPGYKATAVMMGEAALCLALDRVRLPQRVGVLTPASGIGTALADRLRAAGMTLEAGPA